MDYISQKITFKIKKVLRYTRLYGLSRTWIKVRGQYHMERIYKSIPDTSTHFSVKQKIGIIGCGNYAFSNIAYYLKNKFGKVIAACMDIDIHKAASLAQYYKIPFFTDNAQELIDLPGIEIVYIASNHASHAEYAIRCLKAGKHVYIEKPHVVNEDQLIRLVTAIKESKQKVYLGFNRPGSKLGQEIQKYLSEQEGPGIYNWFVAGHQIEPDHWYFKPEEGGRVLGNLCHWTDFLLRLVPPDQAYPIEIVPVCHEKSDSDIAVTYKFNEGTIGTITFSAKGHTFEGVREKFNGHKGNCLISMSDFQKMTVEVLDKKKTYNNFYRDQGHQVNIVKAYQDSHSDGNYDQAKRVSYIWNTAWLFLKTRQALESSRKMILRSYSK